MNGMDMDSLQADQDRETREGLIQANGNVPASLKAGLLTALDACNEAVAPGLTVDDRALRNARSLRASVTSMAQLVISLPTILDKSNEKHMAQCKLAHGQLPEWVHPAIGALVQSPTVRKAAFVLIICLGSAISSRLGGGTTTNETSTQTINNGNTNTPIVVRTDAQFTALVQHAFDKAMKDAVEKLKETP